MIKKKKRHINPSLVLVQPRKTHPYITERLLMGCKESNKKKYNMIHCNMTHYQHDPIIT